jgi:hypothetical protein
MTHLDQKKGSSCSKCKNNKKKNKPKLPLRAYNLFFRYIRNRLLEQKENVTTAEEDYTKITVEDVAQICSKPHGKAME